MFGWRRRPPIAASRMSILMKVSSPAYSGLMIFSATDLRNPDGPACSARLTVAMEPLPSCRTSRYGPTCSGREPFSSDFAI